MTTPNIFTYATSELSQDAFICYLVACANKGQATSDLQKCGSAFVRTLFRAGASDGTKCVPVVAPDGRPARHDGPCKVSDVCAPNRQRYNIDVDFQAKVDGKTVAFLIEDKINTREHSNQLERYLNAVSKDEQDLIKPVYFKTGYVFSDERDAVKKNNYSVFEAEDLKNFLDGQVATKKNEIMRQYAEYLGQKIKTGAEAIAKGDLNQQHVQWEFMLKLHETLEDAAGEWKHFIPDKFSGLPGDCWNGLKKAKNIGGSPWTQYWFSNHLFWRISKLTHGMPLRLMIFRSSTGVDYNVVRDEYRSRFNEVLQQEELQAGCDRKRKGNECTVGSIKTAEFQGMTVDEFLDRVKRVHIGFLERHDWKRHNP